MSPEIFPGSLIQGGVSAHQIANHVPRCNVQSALWRQPHRQRNAALRTERHPLGGGFLARSHPDGLSEHVNRNRLVSSFEFSFTAKTEEIVQAFLVQRLAFYEVLILSDSV